jgi:phosphatidylglycerophosphatase A
MSKKICSSLNKIFVTWFGCGYFPKAPGTAGSFGALPLCWALLQVTFFREFGIYFRILFALLLTLGACFAAAHDQKQNPNSHGNIEKEYINKK